MKSKVFQILSSQPRASKTLEGVR